MPRGSHRRFSDDDDDDVYADEPYATGIRYNLGTFNQEEPTNPESEDASATLKFGFRLFCTTALHPLDYAKTLIQLGYEPIAPRPGRTLFGVKRLMLPNIFQYAHHIGTVDGFTGCFRGLSAKLLGNILSSYYSEKLVDSVGLCVPQQQDKSTKKDDEFSAFINKLQRDTVVQFAGVIISQPFHVISVRMMAQFVGREQLYSGLWPSVKEIWHTEGIAGFFSGIVPRLIVELGCIAITSTVTYLFNKYITKNQTVRGNVHGIAQFTVSSYLYPYHVVSTCMAVNGSRLKAGNPPMMDHFFGWHDCYRGLRMTNSHKRGSSYFFRTASRVPTKLNSPPSISAGKSAQY